MTLRTQSLPWTTSFPLPRVPTLRRIRVSWQMLAAAALVAIATTLVFASGVAIGWTFSHAIVPVTAAEPVVAAPKVAYATEPVVAPAPVAKTLPIISVNWERVLGAPEAHALFVKDNTLYVVQDTAGGAIVWHREKGNWVAKAATPSEQELVWDRA